jgi:hypothetical protein
MKLESLVSRQEDGVTTCMNKKGNRKLFVISVKTVPQLFIRKNMPPSTQNRTKPEVTSNSIPPS